MTETFSYEALAGELVRQLRRGVPQRTASLRLGYRSNVLHTWEVGRRFPTASEALRLAAACGSDIHRATMRFFGDARATSEGDIDPTTPAGVAAFLRAVRGGVAISTLARRCRRSRSRVSRWLGGQTEPRLPDFLRVVEAASMRLLDWLATLVDVARLPSARAAWESLEAQRNLSYLAPYGEAVSRALELADYQKLDRPRPGWIARRLGLADEIETDTLAALARANVVSSRDGRWQLSEVIAVDTSRNRDAVWRLKRHWATVGLERLDPQTDGLFSYNVMGVSHADFERIKQLHLEYFHRLRSIVADSQPVERVVVTNIQLFSLDTALPP